MHPHLLTWIPPHTAVLPSNPPSHPSSLPKYTYPAVQVFYHPHILLFPPLASNPPPCVKPPAKPPAKPKLLLARRFTPGLAQA